VEFSTENYGSEITVLPMTGVRSSGDGSDDKCLNTVYLFMDTP
jgi:hypothetical protein